MLIRFVFENIFSFKEETEFNMVPAKSLKTHPDHLTKVNSRISVLRGSILYGANGAGKSNLVKAADVFQRIVLSGKVPSDIRYLRCRMNALDRPISQTVEFSLEGKAYCYGISYKEGLCTEEWLYAIGSEREKKIFERAYSPDRKTSELSFGKDFDLSGKNAMLVTLLEENILKDDELLIAHRDILKLPELSAVYDWFDKYLSITFPSGRSTSSFNEMYSDDKFRKFAEDVLRGLDVGVDKIMFQNETLGEFIQEVPFIDGNMLDHAISDTKDGRRVIWDTSVFTASLSRDMENGQYYVRRIMTNHKVQGRDCFFELKEESDGTRRLMDYIPLIRDLNVSEVTALIDEIDQSIHPNILLDMMAKLMGSPLSGQLICTSHESILLDCDIFRTDEIWFVEKRKEDQATELYALSDYKPRNDLDIRRGYLKGRFGAVPFLSYADDLKCDPEDAVQK